MKLLLMIVIAVSAAMPAVAAEFQLQAWATRAEPWNSGSQAVAGDFNGDGKDDVAVITATSLCSGNVSVYASSGSNFFYSMWGVGLSMGCSSSEVRWLAGDFNADGRSDLVAVINDGGLNTIRIFQSSGHNFSMDYWTYAHREGIWASVHQWRSGDFDADGKADLAAVWDNGGLSSITVYKTGRYGVEISVWSDRVGGWAKTIKWTPGDFDGNGMTDLIAVWNDGGMNSIAARMSTGVGFVYQDIGFRDGGWGDKHVCLAGDFNGDGRSDVVIVWNDGWMNSFGMYIASGASMVSSSWATKLGGWADTIKWVAGDFDGDGRSDLSAVWNDNSRSSVAVYLSR